MSATAAETFKPIRYAELEWRDGTPYSPAFDDPYYSIENGPAETEYVFIEGNQLKERFATLPQGCHFTIAETGFGTGLNLLAAANAFLEQAPDSCQLHFVSVEAFPIAPADLVKAHEHWPEFQAMSQALQNAYPACAPGFHQRYLHPRITLTLAYGDACHMFERASFKADAWFLDGFAPSRNEQMWNDTLYQRIFELSSTGATLATFTAAGHVRRGLAAAGFEVSKSPGFGHKRHMVTGQKQPVPPHSDTDNVQSKPIAKTALVVGAGLAGATVARALAERGLAVDVVDPLGVAQQASGNLAGVVFPTPSGHATGQNRYYLASYLNTLDWLRRHDFPSKPNEGLLAGLTQTVIDDRHKTKAKTALERKLWPEELVKENAAPSQSDMDDDSPPLALYFPHTGCIAPQLWCQHLIDHPGIQFREDTVTGIDEQPSAVTVTLQSGEKIEADVVILANAHSAQELLETPLTNLKRIRGQVTHVNATEDSQQWRVTQCHSGYLSPAINDIHCVGATFNLHDDTPSSRGEDNQHNLLELKANLPALWQDLGGDNIEVVGQRVGFRTQSPDFLPLAGSINANSPRTFVSIAHGSRGITGSTLCADIIASQICHTPAPVDIGILEALNPQRFSIRKAKKNHKQRKS